MKRTLLKDHSKILARLHRQCAALNAHLEKVRKAGIHVVLNVSHTATGIPFVNFEGDGGARVQDRPGFRRIKLVVDNGQSKPSTDRWEGERFDFDASDLKSRFEPW